MTFLCSERDPVPLLSRSTSFANTTCRRKSLTGADVRAAGTYKMPPAWINWSHVLRSIPIRY